LSKAATGLQPETLSSSKVVAISHIASHRHQLQGAFNVTIAITMSFPREVIMRPIHVLLAMSASPGVLTQRSIHRPNESEPVVRQIHTGRRRSRKPSSIDGSKMWMVEVYDQLAELVLGVLDLACNPCALGNEARQDMWIGHGTICGDLR
jgi:hypothetical protein